MSNQQGNFGGSGGGKKAVHVKWAGKTIALGTFPAAEADEKCARAKALTRAWRSTMRPKPNREWVMVELESLGVRVVSGRLGRKAGEEEEGGPGEKRVAVAPAVAVAVGRKGSMNWSNNVDLDNLMQRRSSSIGLAMMSENDLARRSSLSSLGPALGLDSNDPSMPPHRPLVGGGAAAAYEAARADHYAQKREEQQRRASSLGLGMGSGNLASGGMPQMGLAVNPNQHYEMLKLHHMNLLNEIQETTLMMNLYQQQQLQQQQQQLQQQQASAEGEQHMSMLMQTGGADSLYGGGMSQRGSLALGPAAAPEIQALRQQQTTSVGPVAVQSEILKSQQEQAELEKRLAKLKEDIASREKQAEDLKKTDSDGDTPVAAPAPTAPVPAPAPAPAANDGSPDDKDDKKRPAEDEVPEETTTTKRVKTDDDEPKVKAEEKDS